MNAPVVRGIVAPPGGIDAAADAHREDVVDDVVVVQGEADLLEVVDALRPPRRLPRRLNRRQQQGDQDGNDRDDDQQFDQSEAASYHRNSPSAPGQQPRSPGNLPGFRATAVKRSEIEPNDCVRDFSRRGDDPRLRYAKKIFVVRFELNVDRSRSVCQQPGFRNAWFCGGGRRSASLPGWGGSGDREESGLTKPWADPAKAGMGRPTLVRGGE